MFAIGLAINMLVAALTAHIDNGFFVADGGYELVLLLGVSSIAIAIAGAGRYSVDATIGIARRVPGYPGGERRSLCVDSPAWRRRRRNCTRRSPSPWTR